MGHPEQIILIHALIGVAVEGGGSIVDSYRTGSAEDLDRMIVAFRGEIASLLEQLDPVTTSGAQEPHPVPEPGDLSELPF